MTKPDYPLVIGYIHNGTVRAEFMRSMLNLQQDCIERRLKYKTFDCQGLFIAANRSSVADRFLDQTDAEWLLFIDTDMEFEPEAVHKILAHGDAEHQIVAGLCFTWLKMPSGEIVLGPNWWDRNPAGAIRTVEEIRQDRLNLLAYAGTAFMLIGREVLTRVRHCYRDCIGMATFGHDILHLSNTPTLGGEDITFCMRAKACGFSTWGAGDVEVTHYKTHAENLQTFSMLYGQRRD